MIAKNPEAGSTLETEPPLNLRVEDGAEHGVLLRPLRELLEDHRRILFDFKRDPNPYAEHSYIISRGATGCTKTSEMAERHPWLRNLYRNLLQYPSHDCWEELRIGFRNDIETVLRGVIEMSPLETNFTSLEAQAKSLIDSVHTAELCDEVIDNVFYVRTRTNRDLQARLLV